MEILHVFWNYVKSLAEMLEKHLTPEQIDFVSSPLFLFVIAPILLIIVLLFLRDIFNTLHIISIKKKFFKGENILGKKYSINKENGWICSKKYFLKGDFFEKILDCEKGPKIDY